METRSNTRPVAIETREEGKTVIVGYAAVFYRAGDPGTEYELWEKVRERIARGAFDRALADRHDARGLFNHDPNIVLGRVGAGTVRLSVDDVGLRYEIDAPDTQSGKDVVAMLRRGDVVGSSFAFIVRGDSWQRDRDTGDEIRTIQDVDLLDVSPVTYPAYESTSAGVRRHSPPDEARISYAAYRAALARQELELAAAEAEAMRMRA